MFFKKNTDGKSNFMFDLEKIGNNLMKYRKAAGLTQLELAEKLGISFQAVSNWERGLSCPDVSKLTELSELFEVSVDAILDNRRAAEIISNIENDAFENIKPEELKQIAPLLSQEQAEKSVQEGDWDSSNMDEVAMAAPFLSTEFLNQYARKKIEETGSTQSIQRLIPFLGDDVLEEIADQAYEQGGVSAIRYYAPFLHSSWLDKKAEELLEQGGIQAVSPILPFISSKVLEEYFTKKNKGEE